MASLFKRGKYWWICYYKDGKRYQESLKTVEERVAKYRANEIENQVSRGESPIFDKRINPLVLLEKYYQHNQGLKSKDTCDNEYGGIRLFLDATKPLTIKQITRDLVKDYLDRRLANKEITNITANNIIKYIKTFLAFAKENRYIAEVPKMVSYRVDTKPPRYLTKNETERLIRAAQGESLYPAIMAAIFTGMRFGEIRRLMWEDVDLVNKTIIVRVSKSGKYRTIPLHQSLESVLTRETVPFNFQNHYRVFKRIRKRAGVENVGWHTFRHTFITHLVRNSKDLVAAKNIAGHAKIETTMIYTHVSPDQAREAISHIGFNVDSVDRNVDCETATK